MRVLLVEDEEKVASFVRKGLRGEGWSVEHVLDGESGLEFISNAEFDVIVLDVMLPGISGFDTCRKLRARGNMTPVLMLSALDETDERVSGLEVGADDYLTKPFAFDELIARVSALSRRAGLYSGKDKTTCSDAAKPTIYFDRASLQIFVDGNPIEMSVKERELMVYLLGNVGKVVSRERILNAIWGVGEDPLTNIVDVYIGRARKKISPYEKSITTVRSVGYRFDMP